MSTPYIYLKVTLFGCYIAVAFLLDVWLSRLSTKTSVEFKSKVVLYVRIWGEGQSSDRYKCVTVFGDGYSRRKN